MIQRSAHVKRSRLKPSANRNATRFGGVPANPEHRAFIRTFPCILYGVGDHRCSGRIEAAHTGPHRRGQKAVDESCLPICTNGHQTGQFAQHKMGWRFWGYHGVNREELVGKFMELGRAEGTIKSLAEAGRLSSAVPNKSSRSGVVPAIESGDSPAGIASGRESA